MRVSGVAYEGRAREQEMGPASGIADHPGFSSCACSYPTSQWAAFASPSSSVDHLAEVVFNRAVKTELVTTESTFWFDRRR